jgi:2-iminoacetate synthase ThiH
MRESKERNKKNQKNSNIAVSRALLEIPKQQSSWLGHASRLGLLALENVGSTRKVFYIHL